MIFKSIYFNLNRQDYPNDYGYSLLLKSRFVCNFIEREILKPLRVKTPGFNRIVIEFCDRPGNKIWVNSRNALAINLKFDKVEYDNACKNNVADFFIKYLRLTINSLKDSDYNIPVENINSGLDTFITNGYLNQWLYKKKTNRVVGITSFLDCRLTQDIFELTLRLAKNKKEIFSKVILKLDPDPVAYDYRFKDILFVDNKLIVNSKTSDNLFELDLDKFKE